MSLAEIPGLRARIVAHYRRVSSRDGITSESAFARKHRFTQHQANDWFSDKKHGAPDFGNLRRLAVIFDVTWQELLVGREGADVIIKDMREQARRAKEHERQRLAEVGTASLQRKQADRATRKASNQ